MAGRAENDDRSIAGIRSCDTATFVRRNRFREAVRFDDAGAVRGAGELTGHGTDVRDFQLIADRGV
jgi:hypothetical protein